MLRMFRCIIENEFSFPGPGFRSISPASKSKRHNTTKSSSYKRLIRIGIETNNICV